MKMFTEIIIGIIHLPPTGALATTQIFRPPVTLIVWPVT